MEFKEMELNDMIQFRAHFEKHLDQKLLEMDCFFQDKMWDGYTEDVGQFVSDDDFETIQALTDKIKHMMINIGCPLSVGDMLNSISQRKIKYWGSHWSYENHGKQLRTKADRVLVINERRFEKQDIKSRMVDKGHFRWNNRGYTLSRVATDLLSDYMCLNGFLL